MGLMLASRIGSPWSSIGVSQSSLGHGAGCSGKQQLPTHGREGSYVLASLRLGVNDVAGLLHTVTSERASVLVCAGGGRIPSVTRASSLGSVMMIDPYRPLKTWLVEE
jgi:hypothetical protein